MIHVKIWDLQYIFVCFFLRFSVSLFRLTEPGRDRLPVSPLKELKREKEYIGSDL